MTNQSDRLEKALGGKLERSDSRVVPGSVAVAGTEFVYFSDDGKHPFRKQFKNLTEFTNPPHAKSGGVNERGCRIKVPDGQQFHAIGYHGDIKGWRLDIEAGARALNIYLARIDGDQFIVSDGRTYNLSQCEIEFS
ncbi:hypothetical protein [Burkholderia cenocepacia]|uniref:hypothetical protein n=1 Tax=Burkholderia cenocepacia TaxID=95486 RepID=UPI000F599369|nr:hypothetical protein [Burkholderia cenocepacia]RQU96766.1 hypothetical protein DF040_03845 [Burkholderia cenocepacia]